MSTHSLFSRAFLVATLERAVRSFAASLASLLTASGAGIVDVDWGEKFSVAGMAALVTVLLAVGGGTFGRGEGPSFVGGEKLVQRPPAVQPSPEPATGRPGSLPAVV